MTALLAGVGLGSLTWMSALAGAGVLAFGGLLAYRTMRD